MIPLVLPLVETPLKFLFQDSTLFCKAKVYDLWISDASSKRSPFGEVFSLGTGKGSLCQIGQKW
jgi:hypothetical protein